MSANSDVITAQNAIAAAISQHVSYQYRASTAVVNSLSDEIDELAEKLAKDLLHRLDNISQTEMQNFLVGRYNTTRLQGLRDKIDEYATGLAAALSSNWTDTAIVLAGYEATYIAELLGKVISELPSIKFTDKKVYRAAMDTPLSGGAPYGGRLVDTLLHDFSEPKRQAIYAAIRAGVVAGDTNSDIVKTIRGTKALNYQDGLVYQTKMDAERLVRTARSHISNQSYSYIYDELDVEYVIDVATLDGRTSKYCASIDGRKHEADKPHHVPPYHPHCRTVQIPALDGNFVGNRPYVRALKVKGRDGERTFRSVGNMTKNQREKAGLEVGQVSGTTDYSKWFGDQDTTFKREWLGPTRYKLYSEGKYTLSRFVDPRTGHQYTIDELRMRDADTFLQIFGE